MDTVGINMYARQIRECSAFNLNRHLARTPLLQMAYKFLVIFSKYSVSLYGSFCAVERELTVDDTLYRFSLIRFVHLIGFLLLEVNSLHCKLILLFCFPMTGCSLYCKAQ
jgi:hypothetical protein